MLNLRQSGPRAQQVARYVELDFVENTTRKAMAIRKSKELSSLLGKSEDVKIGTESPNLGISPHTE